jgi:hypothetical protein
MRTSLLLLLALGLLTVASALAGSPVTFEEDFSTDLGAWEFWSNTLPGEPFTYQLLHEPGDGSPAPAARLSGDWDTQDSNGSPEGRNFGMQHIFPGLARFHVTFDWRAYSDNSTTTRARLEIVDATDDTILHSQHLLLGGVLDTGWLTFPPTDFSTLLPANSSTDVYVRISVRDGWHANHHQVLLVDNFQLIPVGLEPPPDVPLDTDDFATDTAAWTFWRETQSNPSHSYSLSLDETEGMPPPSAHVTGNFDYSGQTLRYGMERTVPVTLPFVVSMDWFVEDVTSSAGAPITFQLLETDGTLLHTWTMEPEGTWSLYQPPDLTPNVLGLSEVIARAWIVGAHDANPANHLWLDNFSWTRPCTTPLSFYEDSDGDSHGDPSSTHPYGDMCYPLPGWVADSSDCDDGQPEVFPGNDEVCDGLDNDCDPATDESRDEDGDGSPSCPDEDCNDEDPAVHPGAEELCNGWDDDCDPATGLDGEDQDADGDGVLACAGDCDDSDPESWPGAPEDCDDEVDQDCDGAEAAEEIDPDCAAAADDDDGAGARRDGCSCSVGHSQRGSGVLLLVGSMWLGLRRRRAGAKRSLR